MRQKVWTGNSWWNSMFVSQTLNNKKSLSDEASFLLICFFWKFWTVDSGGAGTGNEASHKESAPLHYTASHCNTLLQAATHCRVEHSNLHLLRAHVICCADLRWSIDALIYLRWSITIYYDKLHAKTAALSCLVAPAFEGQAYTECCWSIWGRRFQRGGSLAHPHIACGEEPTRAFIADWGAPLAASPLPSPPLSTFNHGKHPLIWGWFQMLIIYMYCCIYKYMHSSLQLD